LHTGTYLQGVDPSEIIDAEAATRYTSFGTVAGEVDLRDLSL
jgi:hypothetical protein